MKILEELKFYFSIKSEKYLINTVNFYLLIAAKSDIFRGILRKLNLSIYIRKYFIKKMIILNEIEFYFQSKNYSFVFVKFSLYKKDVEIGVFQNNLTKLNFYLYIKDI